MERGFLEIILLGINKTTQFVQNKSLRQAVKKILHQYPEKTFGKVLR